MALLNRIRAACGEFIAVGALGSNLETVRRELGELEQFGFELERHPYLGIAYRGPARRLCPDQIEWGLAARRIGRRIAVWNRVTSTNDLAARAASSSANDGLVILAEEQSDGRGRRGRSWSAPAESSVLLSVLLFPPPEVDDPIWLTALGAVAAAEVIEQFADRPASIKWPNDVRVGAKKIAGILVERGTGAVVGIGVNVNVAIENFPQELRDSATSVRALIGRVVDRSEFAKSLIQRLDAFYESMLADGPHMLEEGWRSRLEALWKPVYIETASGTLQGRLVDADLRKGLTLADDNGALQGVRGGDVLSVSLVSVGAAGA
jgi:BirA family biotin operon repressor/biotin-[acetyl-CoA-carboxylase] ligase